MRTRLAVLQFPLLFCLGTMIGLSVYGAHFQSVVGYIYLVPLLLVPVVLPRIGPRPLARLRRHARVLAAAGVVLGAVAYRPLHLSFWDGQSVAQAVAVSAFGTLSAVMSWLAVSEATGGRGNGSWQTAAVLALVAAFFLLASAFPMIPLLGAALFLAPAVTLRWETDAPAWAQSANRRVFVNALAFYLAFELGEVVWDFGSDPAWGPQLAVACLAAGAVALLFGRRGAVGPSAAAPGRRANVVALAVTVAVGLVTALHPVFVLSPLRQGLLGLALGTLLVTTMTRVLGAPDGPATALGVWLWFAVGLAVSNLYAAQLLAFPAGRLAFAVPAIVALFVERWRAAAHAGVPAPR
jgi:hypothetical protein